MTNLTSPYRRKREDKKPTRIQALKAGLLLAFIIGIILFILNSIL